MSLINDALKRASAAQQQTPPPPADHLPLRAADPQAAVTHGVGLAMPVVFAATALLLLFFVWRFYMDQNRRAQHSLAVAARSETNQEAVPQAAPPPAPVAVPVAGPAVEPAPKPVPAPAPVPAAVSAPVQPAAAVPATNSAAVAAAKPEAAPAPNSTNDAAAAVLAASKLPPLKLQGVVYSKTRPSAVISGKTVFLGDRVRDFRVVGIGIDNVTLVGAGRTNVLVLSD